MSAMDKVNNILGKLPFVKLAGNIPEGIRGKIPFLNVLIPFANHIASGAAIVVLVAALGGGGGSGGLAGTEWQNQILGNSVLTFGQSEYSITFESFVGQQGTYKISGGNKAVLYTTNGEEVPVTIGELTLTIDKTGTVFQKVK